MKKIQKNLNLHAPLWAWIEEQVRAGGYSSHNDWLQARILEETTRYIYTGGRQAQAFASLMEMEDYLLDGVDEEWVLIEGDSERLDIRVQDKKIMMHHPETGDAKEIGRVDALI
jgi:hypothetical protein